ncbi:MAG TPA: hypothetical protein VNS11_00585 [Sphingomicrobium sp.]|nr:hypothetical protein [Sphingomicrobium sp.]
MARRLLVLLLVLVIAVQVVRNAAVAAFADGSPDLASRVWPGHPAAETSLAMTEIGRAARQGKPVPAAVFAMVDDAARKAPLAPEPFLVHGVQAQLAGNAPLAIEAFAAASRRDPRSLPAHYFLADTLFRSGDARRGLDQVAVLARLAPGGLSSVAPYVAAYARDRKTWPQLRELFRSEPDLEEAALSALAADPNNVGTIIALADQQHRGPNATWLPPLVNGLVAARQYAKARAVWSTTSRAQADGLVYDPDFSDANAPPPFNWMLMSSTVGLAERRAGGGLHVIFYGREDGLMARQLLILPPGQYRISMSATGNPGDSRALNWSLRCDGSQAPLAAMPLDVAATRPWTFTVPASCLAQWLELSGVSSDVSHQSEATVNSIRLVAERSSD